MADKINSARGRVRHCFATRGRVWHFANDDEIGTVRGEFGTASRHEYEFDTVSLVEDEYGTVSRHVDEFGIISRHEDEFGTVSRV